MTHAAITKAQEIYDRPGELRPNEQIFLTEVHKITMHCVRTKGQAARDWGNGSRAYEATAYLADRKQSADLAFALDTYEQGLEDQDEILAIELAAAEAMAE
jgi:hypothetical protein